MLVHAPAGTVACVRATVGGGAAHPQRLPWVANWRHHPTTAPAPVGSKGSEMLVLTRKTNQSIMIGDEIEVSVLAVSRDKIRLGITAPRSIPVFRKEVYLSIKEEQGGEERAKEQVEHALDELSNSE